MGLYCSKIIILHCHWGTFWRSRLNMEKSNQNETETMLRAHTGDKPQECSHCDEAFQRKGYLKIH